MSEAHAADGSSPSSSLLSNHVDGPHGVPALGELGGEGVEFGSPICLEVLGGQDAKESRLVWGESQERGKTLSTHPW